MLIEMNDRFASSLPRFTLSLSLSLSLITLLPQRKVDHSQHLLLEVGPCIYRCVGIKVLATYTRSQFDLARPSVANRD